MSTFADWHYTCVLLILSNNSPVLKATYRSVNISSMYKAKTEVSYKRIVEYVKFCVRLKIENSLTIVKQYFSIESKHVESFQALLPYPLSYLVKTNLFPVQSDECFCYGYLVLGYFQYFIGHVSQIQGQCSTYFGQFFLTFSRYKNRNIFVQRQTFII